MQINGSCDDLNEIINDWLIEIKNKIFERFVQCVHYSIFDDTTEGTPKLDIILIEINYDLKKVEWFFPKFEWTRLDLHGRQSTAPF